VFITDVLFCNMKICTYNLQTTDKSFSLLNVQIYCLSRYYSLRFIYEYKLILLQIQICIVSAFVLIFSWSHSHYFDSLIQKSKTSSGSTSIDFKPNGRTEDKQSIP